MLHLLRLAWCRYGIDFESWLYNRSVQYFVWTAIYVTILYGVVIDDDIFFVTGLESMMILINKIEIHDIDLASSFLFYDGLFKLYMVDIDPITLWHRRYQRYLHQIQCQFLRRYKHSNQRQFLWHMFFTVYRR